MFQLENDRPLAILEAALVTEVKCAENQLSAIMLEHESNMACAECKVFTESGTDEDLMTLYMEATEQAAEKAQGPIGKIFSAIRKFLAGIGERISKIFGGKEEKIEGAIDPNAKVSVEYNADEVDKEATGLLNEAKQVMAKIKSGATDAKDAVKNFVAKVSKIALAGTAVTITGVVAYKGFKKLKGKDSSMDEAIKKLEEMTQNEKSPEKIALMQQVASAVSKVTSKFGKAKMGLVAAVSKVIKKKGNDATDGSDEDADNNKTAKQKKEGTKPEMTGESADEEWESALSAIAEAL